MSAPTRDASIAAFGDGPQPGFAAGVSAAGSRIALLAMAWLVYASTSRPLSAGLVIAAYALGGAVFSVLGAALARRGDGRGLAIFADVASVLAIAGFGGVYSRGPVLMYAAAVVLGVLRGIADQAYGHLAETAVTTQGKGKRPHPLIPVALGVAGGAAIGWLGAVAMVCVVALAWLISATVTVWQTPQPAKPSDASRAPLDAVTQEIAIYRPMRRPEISLRAALGASAVEALGVAGAFALAVAWTRDVIGPPDATGLVGGALLAGALAAVGAMQRAGNGALTVVGVAVGFAGGAIPGLINDRLPVHAIFVALVAFGAGAILIMGAPARDAIVDYTGASQERMLSPGLAAAVAYLLMVPAVVGGAEIVARLRAPAALITAAVCYLIAVMAALLTRPAPPDIADNAEILPLGQRYAGTAVWVAVTLIYANGEWTAEVERKRGVGEGARGVPAADALRAVAALELPGLRAEVESAIADDQVNAEREVERMRAELKGLGQKLDAINEMVDLSEVWRTAR